MGFAAAAAGFSTVAARHAAAAPRAPAAGARRPAPRMSAPTRERGAVGDSPSSCQERTVGLVSVSAAERNRDAGESEHGELVRLRVEASTLGAENESLKAQAKELQEQLLVQEAARRSETRDLAGSKRAVSEGAARRVAELEVLVERQRAALHDLVVASDSLASDNLLLSSGVVTLRGEKGDLAKKVQALEGRIGTLQELYLTGARAAEGAGPKTVREANQTRFWEEMTTQEVLLRDTKPPSYFPVDKVQYNREMTHLRKQREALKAKVKALTTRVAELAEAHDEVAARAASQQRGSKEELGRMHTKLVGAMRRIKYLVEVERKREGDLKEKDHYIAKLEALLLSSHRRSQGLQAKPLKGGTLLADVSASLGSENFEESLEWRGKSPGKAGSKGPPPLEPAELDLSHAGEGEWEGGMPELRDKIMTGGEVDIAELELFTRKLHALHAVRVVGSPKGGD